jgi:hypothetical protein
LALSAISTCFYTCKQFRIFCGFTVIRRLFFDILFQPHFI